MTPYYADEAVTLHHGDALDVLRTLPDASVDAVVTDPPYGLADHHPRVIATALAAWLAGDRDHVPDGKGFMGRNWDRFVPPPALWDECWRVLKPGGHLLAFAAPRTADLMGMSARLAGFEIRDGIDWVFASGFPKGQDIGKAIDRMRAEDRPAVLRITAYLAEARRRVGVTHKAIDDAFGFNGMAVHWTTQKRAACVPTVEQWERLRGLLGFDNEMDAEVARLNGRKGEVGKNFAAREVVGSRHAGLGAGSSSVFLRGAAGVDERGHVAITAPASDAAKRWHGWNTSLKPAREPIIVARKSTGFNTTAANVLEHGTGALNIDACRTTAGQDYRNKCASVVGLDSNRNGDAYGECAREDSAHPDGRWPTNVVFGHDCPDQCRPGCPVGELGETARFFPVFRYEAKATSAERPRVNGVAHPTVKPLDLMRWLVRLVTPTAGTVLEPFAGSGTTAEACALEGLHCIAVEREADYLPLITARLTKALQPALDLGAVA
ncbi:site-specific DNA-methyltransferase [Micromonospora sp. NBC_01740]|uniref:DNA methyltransferase n=1 Tax=Micromonospora sp. NBC_01740 TaxID=2975986 RepID=UPI002E151700|nr:site-specific DNA-methyltransferase [Micromonospora sp. NBC_01740]